MEKLTGSELGKEDDKAGYYHCAYLSSMQSKSYEMPGWVNHKLESKLLGEMSATSYMQMMPLYWQKVRGTKETLDQGKRGE